MWGLISDEVLLSLPRGFLCNSLQVAGGLNKHFPPTLQGLTTRKSKCTIASRHCGIIRQLMVFEIKSGDGSFVKDLKMHGKS